MKKVILYISSQCYHCSRIEQYLLDNGILFEKRDIVEDGSSIDQLKEMKIMTVPVLLVDDNVVIGFNKDKIDALLL